MEVVLVSQKTKKSYNVLVQRNNNQATVRYIADNISHNVIIEKIDEHRGIIFFIFNNTRMKARFIKIDDTYIIAIKNASIIISIVPVLLQPQFSNQILSELPSTIVAPLTGRIVKLYVSENSHVTKDAPLFVIESMKMENEIRTPCDAFIKTISIAEGDVVHHNQVVMNIEANNNLNVRGENEEKQIQNRRRRKTTGY